MRNRWGNDDHGPGGDPSWLGGKDRDGTQGSGGWSSDFGSGDARPDADFASSDPDGGRWGDPQAAQQMAPRFGDHAEGGPLPSGRDEGSPWKAAFTGQETKGAGGSGSGVSRVLRAVLPIIVTVIFAVVFLRMFTNFGSGGGFFQWWMLLFFGIPLLKRILRIFRGRDD